MDVSDMGPEPGPVGLNAKVPIQLMIAVRNCNDNTQI